MKNKEYCISVDEPWDFVGPDGKNVIKGQIIEVIDSDCIVFKSNHILNFNKLEGNIFVLISRHQGYNFYNINTNGFWTFGGGLLLTNEYKNMSREELEKNSKYVIIGSFDKEPH
ncbi:hypothetical protein [Leptospira adleri]|uniref:hypothetical protein n=1 Tax=Leptospira adleri TaxID=2023186 RepID=UPI001083FB4B|nr:hypothetical protein [Leptospira adleri]TGM52875.1 hypothetical protein EHQ97_13225 [Leptospira adleri]